MSAVSDLVIVGHISIDRIVLPSGHIETSLGGPPTYSGFPAKILGADVSIISKVGFDFRDEFLLRYSRASIFTGNVKRCKSPTTRFYIEYSSDWSRRLRLISKCEPIFDCDVPRDFKCRALLIAPICGEIPESTLLRLLEVDCIRAVDLQGFIRVFKSDGSIELARWPYDFNVLGKFHVVKASEEELLSALDCRSVAEAIRLMRRIGVEILLVTLGSRGSLVACPSGVWRVPAFPAETADPTGGGDAFIGSFLASYVKSGDVLRSLAVGAASASFVVESIGSSSFGFRDEVYERADYILERVKRVVLA